MNDRLKVFSGTSNPQLAGEICAHLGVPLGDATISTFSNDNLFVQIGDNVRERDVFVVQPVQTPTSIVELLLLLDTLRSASAARITAVIPYYSYARSDKKDMPRISIAARLLADVIVRAGANRVLTMTLHSAQVQGFFSVPCDHLAATPILCDHFAAKLELSDFVALAADAGSAKRAGAYAQRLNLPLAFVDKRRVSDLDVEVRSVVGEVRGKHVIIFDDEIAAAGSLAETVKAIRRFDVGDIYAAATHGVLSGPAPERIRDMDVREVVVTNTLHVPPEKRDDKVTVLSVASLFAEAIKRIHTGESVSALFG
ncbi:MAG TPA: ribose-phosphate pyrophosphokinase [Armatimonadota bacterium]|nr:ribose-phosphate pyrophosphokinase [Armatimonadota bacterium]